jgi:hypothetical protein
VCDNVIRQTDVKTDLVHLGDCVSAIGHTVLLLEPWNDPQPLKRAYCIKEVYHTQASGATFDMVMSTEQQQAFERALVKVHGDDNFDSIKASLSRVDVRQVRAEHPGCIRAAARQFHILYPSLRQPHTPLLRPEQCAVSGSQADCRNTKDKADILAELEKGVGFDKCNALVVGLLREALLAQGRARAPEPRRIARAARATAGPRRRGCCSRSSCR